MLFNPGIGCKKLLFRILFSITAKKFLFYYYYYRSGPSRAKKTFLFILLYYLISRSAACWGPSGKSSFCFIFINSPGHGLVPLTLEKKFSFFYYYTISISGAKKTFALFEVIQNLFFYSRRKVSFFYYYCLGHPGAKKRFFENSVKSFLFLLIESIWFGSKKSKK